MLLGGGDLCGLPIVILLFHQVKLCPIIVLQVILSNVQTFDLCHQLLLDGENILEVTDRQFFKQLFMLSILSEFHLKLRKDGPKALSLVLLILNLLLELLVLLLHFVVDFVDIAEFVHFLFVLAAALVEV